jgi:hypothetical protein
MLVDGYVFISLDEGGSGEGGGGEREMRRFHAYASNVK